MLDIDLDELIRAMQETNEDMTYYLDKESGEIVYVDENVATKVEEEYDEADTVIEEWSADVEDDDMYHENIFSPTEEVDEKELIKRIRFTHQDNYEPVPIVTFSELKRIARKFIDELNDLDENLMGDLNYGIETAENEEEIDQAFLKIATEKNKWIDYREGRMKEKVYTWLKGLGI